MKRFIPLSVPNLKGNELHYVTNSIKSEWVSTGGQYISRFEDEFVKYSKATNAVAVQSGTAALHLCMIESGIGAGDLVIAPALTFVAAVNPVRYVGAEPVFLDCDDSLCIDPDILERYLEYECRMYDGVCFDKSQSKPIKAIIVVHVFGNGADMERIMELAKHYNLIVIEDASEAVGTFFIRGRYKSRMAGTIGDFGAYSFNGNKIITTGGGGMFVTKDAGSAGHARHLSTQAKSDELYFDHDEIGYNYRMTNLQAALGLAQLEQLEEFICIKRSNYEFYQKLGVDLLPFVPYVRPNYWFYSFLSNDRDGLIEHLTKCDIQARPVWRLMHWLPMYKNCRAYLINKAMKYHSQVVNLPCSSNLRPCDVERVADCVMEFQVAAHLHRQIRCTV